MGPGGRGRTGGSVRERERERERGRGSKRIGGLRYGRGMGGCGGDGDDGGCWEFDGSAKRRARFGQNWGKGYVMMPISFPFSLLFSHRKT